MFCVYVAQTISPLIIACIVVPVLVIVVAVEPVSNRGPLT
jgi:hypothetical protein